VRFDSEPGTLIFFDPFNEAKRRPKIKNPQDGSHREDREARNSVLESLLTRFEGQKKMTHIHPCFSVYA
jgi:hypothetical protein